MVEGQEIYVPPVTRSPVREIPVDSEEQEDVGCEESDQQHSEDEEPSEGMEIVDTLEELYVPEIEGGPQWDN